MDMAAHSPIRTAVEQPHHFIAGSPFARNSLRMHTYKIPHKFIKLLAFNPRIGTTYEPPLPNSFIGTTYENRGEGGTQDRVRTGRIPDRLDREHS